LARGGVAFLLRFRTGAEDLLKLKKFAPHPQKRLDTRRFCTYSGAGTSLFYFVFALYGAAGVDPVGSDLIKVDPRLDPGAKCLIYKGFFAPPLSP